MIEPTRHELEHALRYATEVTKLYMMDKCARNYAEAFAFATLVKRPATSRDYYVPPSLASECIVVTQTAFRQGGCERIACFPFKESLEKCEKGDAGQWVPFGKGYTLACQPMCREKAFIDAEWRKDACYMVNPIKKLIAMFPENIFGQKSKHPMHYGLDWVDGHLKLNSTYCGAYGLQFDGSDCSATLQQSIFELVVGKTIYRATFIPNVPPFSRPSPPPVPNYATVKGMPKKRKKRSLSSQTTTEINDEDDATEDTPEVNKLATEIARELSADLGIDIGMWLVKRILKEKVPKLVVSATTNIVIRSAAAQAVFHTYAQMTVQAAKIMGSAASAVGVVLSVYGIVSMIVDFVDPYHLNKILSYYAVRDMNRILDLKYFQKENGNHQIVTPEYMWDYVLGAGEDESDRYEYMAEKMQEYITALHGDAPDRPLPPIADAKFKSKQTAKQWSGAIQIAVVWMLITLTGFCWQWIQVWAFVAFFLILWWTPIKV